MGLFSWIKEKYYDNRLEKADNLVEQGSLSEAEEIYRDLLGKQERAVVNLADMFVNHSNKVEEKLSALKSIVELRDYTDENNGSDFEQKLSSHIDNIEKMSSEMFNKGRYHEAVLLIDAIGQYRKNKDLVEKKHKLHAYLAFSKSQQTSDYVKLLTETIDELKQYEKGKSADISYFIKSLKSKNRFVRIVHLLIPFLSIDIEYKKTAIESIVEVVLKKDDDIKNPSTLSSICPDKNLCAEAAQELVKLSHQAAKKSDFKTSVLYDDFASEFCSSDNQFNNSRCTHILEELSSRANAKEISKLLKTAKDLKLTSAQVDSLKSRISLIAQSAKPEDALEICRLFPLEKTFDSIYITKSEQLVSAGKNRFINENELLQIIKTNSDEDTFTDVISPFVGIKFFEKIFLDSAIAKIQRHKSTSFLEKYWGIKESPIYFEELIIPSSSIAKDFVKFISNKHKLFLHTKELRSTFCKSLDKLKDNTYAYSAAEYLIQKKCDINSYYITVALKETERKSLSQSLDVINHSLSVLLDEKLLNKKKQIIRLLIEEGNYDIAEREIKSLANVDKETETLCAELYYTHGKTAKEYNEKKDLFFLTLDVCEQGKVFPSFDSKKVGLLNEISKLAKLAYAEKRESEAYDVLSRIVSYSTYWLPLYIELRNNDLAKQETLGKKVRFTEESISQIVTCVPKTKEINSSLYFSLWDNYIDLLSEKQKSQPKDKAIESLQKVRSLIKDNCSEKYVAEKNENLTKELVKIEWSYATELEADLDFVNAIKLYEAVKSEKVSSYQGRSELRALICSIKANKVNATLEKRIYTALNIKSHESLKDDLAYRYAYYLLQNTRPGDAEKLLKKYLPNESTLLGLCESIYIKESEKYLTEFNQKIQEIAKGSMSVDAATSFLKEIDNYKARISNRLPDTTSKFESYKKKIESYILREMFYKEQYESLFEKLLSMYPKFMDNDNQFRNVAIAALGLVESGNAKGANLKYAISIWLSAVYTDRLFVKSLDYTSWDDDFTFTLQDSYGQTDEYDYDNLPENINFDEPVDNHNIAIKDVQESLSSRMETFIRDNYPKSEQFFNDEKDALNGLIDLNLDQDCIIASPYLSSKINKVKKSIKSSIDYDVEQGYDNKEDALKLGVTYGFTDSIYSDYSDAQQKVEQCKSSVKASLSTIRTAFASLPQIRSYSKLYASLKSFVSSRMNEDIKSQMDYKQFIDSYEIICKAFKEAPLSLSFSNYANGEIVRRLNNDEMQLRDGVGYMVRVYNIAPSSIQVKKNLEGMLQGLAIQAEQYNSSSDRAIVDRAVQNTGNVFKAVVEDARVQSKLSGIVAKVNGNSMSKDKALKEVYELYKTNPNNDRICENLVTLCDMCIMEYIIGDKWGSSSVKTILNALNNNKSAAFNRHKVKLAQSYSRIWNQIPYENRLLLSGGIGYGTSLNDKGLALKAGLDYYKKLGDVPSSRGLGGIFGTDLPF